MFSCITIRLVIKYLIVLICITDSIVAQKGGVGEPGKYNSHYLDKYYKRFYRAPKPFDTLVNSVLSASVWRIIDINQSENKYIFYGNSKSQLVDLFEIIKFGLITGKINAFRTENFSQHKTNMIPLSEIKLLLISKPDTVTETIFDSDGKESTETRIEQSEVSSVNLQGYIVKEDWYMDNHWGKVSKRIVGLCPIYLDKQTNTTKPMFWIYYSECRQLFSAFEAKNNYPDARITFDELFLKRNFYSVITKHSNVFNRNVASYKIGYDTFLEDDAFNKKLNDKDFDFFNH